MHPASCGRPAAETTRIGYVDEVGGFDSATTSGDDEFVSYESTDAATAALVRGDIAEYLSFPRTTSHRARFSGTRRSAKWRPQTRHRPSLTS